MYRTKSWTHLQILRSEYVNVASNRRRTRDALTSLNEDPVYISAPIRFTMDRVKVELGKVYHPLAFSSTMPRNLMPGHLTSGCDDRASANLERLQRSKDKVWGRLDAPVMSTALLLSLRRVLCSAQCVDQVCARQARGDTEGACSRCRRCCCWLAARERVCVAMLQMEREFRRRDDLRGSNKRLGAFRSGISRQQRAEAGLAPPDQTGFLRTYDACSKLVWAQGEVRSWYNKYGAEAPEDVPNVWQFAGASTNKLVITNCVDAPPPRSPAASSSARSSLRSSASSVLLPSERSPMLSTAAGGVPGVRRQYVAALRAPRITLAPTRRSLDGVLA